LVREYSEFDIDYEIVQTLGEGGFGRVLLVRNRKRNVQFAMKELSESSPDMYREVELMVTLTRTNPHVVSYFDRFVRTDANGETRYCIMMDYVRGLNLLDYVKKGKPVNNTVVYWFLRSALEALAHLHDMRISHRDIKPENYIVAPHRLDDGNMVQRLVTIDFGLGSFLKRGGVLYNSDAEEIVSLSFLCVLVVVAHPLFVLILYRTGWNSQLQFATSD
jgi:serine/threonine protein kinase